MFVFICPYICPLPVGLPICLSVSLFVCCFAVVQCSGLAWLLVACVFTFDLLTPDVLTTTASTATGSPAAATAVTSLHLVASCDVTRCHDSAPSQQLSLADQNMYSDTSCSASVLSTLSESASVGESFLTAELPLQCDSLPTIQLSSPSANQNSTLLTLQSLDVNDKRVNYDQCFEKHMLNDLDMTDGTVVSDDNQTGDSLRAGTQSVTKNLYSPSKHGRQQTISNTNAFQIIHIHTTINSGCAHTTQHLTHCGLWLWLQSWLMPQSPHRLWNKMCRVGR